MCQTHAAIQLSGVLLLTLSLCLAALGVAHLSALIAQLLLCEKRAAAYPQEFFLHGGTVKFAFIPSPLASTSITAKMSLWFL